MEIHQPIIIYSAEPWQRVRANNPAEVNWTLCVLKSSEQHCTASLSESEWHRSWCWVADELTDWLHKVSTFFSSPASPAVNFLTKVWVNGAGSHITRGIIQQKSSPQRLPLQCELSTNKPSAADVNPGPPAQRAAPGRGEGWVAVGPACKTYSPHH